MDLRSLVQHFRVAGGLTVTRRTPGATTSLGKFAIGTQEVVVDPIAIHPANSRQIERLPEALRSRGAVAVYTTEALREPADGQLPDRFDWRGRTYELAQAEDYGAQGQVYGYTATLVEART